MAAIQVTVLLLYIQTCLLSSVKGQSAEDNKRYSRLEHQVDLLRTQLKSVTFALEDAKERYTEEKRQLEHHLMVLNDRLSQVEVNPSEVACRKCTADLDRKMSTLQYKVAKLDAGCVKQQSSRQYNWNVTNGLLVIGGGLSDRSVDLYVADSDTWSPRRPLPRQMNLFGAAKVVVNDTQLVYVCGGNLDSNACLRYDVELDLWIDDVASLVESRFTFDMVSPGDGYMYALGGHYRETIERYNFQTNVWTVVGSLPKLDDPESRRVYWNRHVAATSILGDIFILGYDASHNLGRFWRWNPARNGTFTELPVCPMKDQYGRKPFLLPVGGDQFRQNDLDMIYVVTDATPDVLYRYVIAAGRWETIKLSGEDADMPGWEGAGIALQGNQLGLYLVGGSNNKSKNTVRVDRLVLDRSLEDHSRQLQKMASVDRKNGLVGETVSVLI